jgi:nucleoside phosphorylase
MLDDLHHAANQAPPSHILLAAAVAFELRPFARRLGLEAPAFAIAHGKHGERHVSLLSTGMGRPGDDAFTAALRDLQPDAVINVGIAGALDEQHPAGSTWIVDEWRAPDPPHDRTATADPALSEHLAGLLSAAGWPCGRARAVMVDEPLQDPHQRDRVRARSGAHLVEMEGAAWAAIAKAMGVPFAAVRVVSDHADRPLPGPRPRGGGRRDWLLRDDGRPRKRRLAWALLVSGAWLRPRRHLAEVKAAGGQLRQAAAALEGVAGALLPSGGAQRVDGDLQSTGSST